MRVRRTDGRRQDGESIWVKCIAIDERSGRSAEPQGRDARNSKRMKQGGGEPAAAPAAQG